MALASILIPFGFALSIKVKLHFNKLNNDVDGVWKEGRVQIYFRILMN